ncbi:histidine-rich protein PFHRP-III-like [Teleopsis dalmanni]|uniref:histidine-rich protein PFHRP-III-like n=1 Tax=Teleopsis dalmanni TaxID=139649 RepID=UPI0018CF7FE1|nr:histidine-rich protein PFHRP-III-like [Teleopsis dalmanni]
MKPFFILAALLVATCSAYPYGAVSTQFQHLDPHSHTYSYGYSDPNSQKHESRSHDGVTRGSYSYVDGHGHLQSLSYTADPHTGFKAVGTNLPEAPSPIAVAHQAAAHAYVPYSHASIGHPVVLTHGGVPVDTPEVQHAKAEHAAAHAAAAAAAHYPGHHLYKRSLYGGNWAYAHQSLGHVPLTHGGVPIDTPDVQAAKAEHYAAHAKALGAYSHASHSTHSIAPAVHAHGYHIPVIHNGVPVETPEVQHAKASHYTALAEASARAGPSGHDDGHYDGRWDGGHYDGGNYGGGHYDGGNYGGGHYDGGHKGPIHIPVIHNGVPVEPAEVQHARAAHLSALAAASHGAGHHY